MPIRVEESAVFLEGRCPPEEAEALLDSLRAMPGPAVDLIACEDLHTAVLQVLLAVNPTILNPPRDPLLAACLGSEVAAGDAAAPATAPR